MGWTSKPYRGSESHTSITAQEAFKFLREEFGQYDFAAYHFIQAKNGWEHNECYVIMRNTNGGKPFICVILIDIKDGEIYWEEIEESMGPAYYNCPYKFFDFITVPDNSYSKKWRMKCKRRLISFKPIVEYYD